MKKFICIVLGLALISTAFTQNINLTKGQKFSVDNKSTVVVTQTFMGQAMETNAEMTAKYSIEVKDIQENNYNLVNTFTKIKAKMSAAGNEMNFDSDKKEDMAGENAASFKDLINKPKDVVMDKSGKIVSVKKEETKTASAQPDMMKMMVYQFLGDPEENGYGAKFAFVTTASKIAAGYSWTDTTNKEGMQRTTTYTVKEIKGNDAVVSISGNLNAETKSQMQGMDMVTKSKGNLNGEEIIDITTGIIKERKSTIESTGTITVPSQGIEIPTATKIIFVSSVKPM